MAAEISKPANISLETFPRYRYVIAGLVIAANFIIGLLWSAIAPVLPLAMEDFSISASSASLLISIPVLIKATMGLPGSLIISRFGLKRVFTVSWYLVGGLALTAFAPNYSTVLVLRMAYGVGTGLMMPALGTIIMQWFPSKERTVINSMNLVIMSIGVSISYIITVPLANALSWRSALGILGAIGLLGAFAWSFLGKTRSENQEAEAKLTLRDIWQVFSNRTIFLLVMGDSLVFALYACLSNWLPTFYYETRGMSLLQAGNTTGLIPFMGIFAVIVGGYLTLKIRNKRLFFIIPGIMVVLGGFGSFLIESTAGIYMSVILMSVGAWIYQPILLSLPMELPWMTPNKIAVVWGSSMTLAGIGMFLSPIIAGASKDLSGSYVPGFIIAAIPALSLILTGIFLPKSDIAAKNLNPS
jgi:CP family cyanate transporter-like MFS transporter